MKLSIYLLFDGTCLPAMQFYHACLGGKLTITKVSDTPMKESMPPSLQEKVINAQLVGENVHVSASDWLRPDQHPVQGNTVCLYLNGGTLETMKVYFDKLSEGAEITDPLTEQFFGVYGALNDRFGIRWMFYA